MSVQIQSYQSPIGMLYLAAENENLCAVGYEQNWEAIASHFGETANVASAVLERTKEQLDQYFGGSRKVFDLRLFLRGTSFQQTVWSALAKIPFGEVRTYKQQATLIGKPNAARAVGRTNGLNPLSIILPCHRVVGADGTLTGYAGGLSVKKYLLELEAKHGTETRNNQQMELLAFVNEVGRTN